MGNQSRAIQTSAISVLRIKIFSLLIVISVAIDQNFKLQANANWLVCEEECIPQKGRSKLPKPLDVQSDFQYIKSGAIAMVGLFTVTFNALEGTK